MKAIKTFSKIFNLAEEVKVSKANLKKLIGRKLARVLKTWVEDFVDEDTGEVVSIERNDVIIDRESVLDSDNIEAPGIWHAKHSITWSDQNLQIMLSSIIRFRKTLVTLKRKLSCIFIVSCEMQNLQMKQVPVKLFRTCSSLKSVMI